MEYGKSMRKVLLVSNKVMHYRVSVYNYFADRFRDHGWEFIVRASELQKENPHPLRFDFKAVDFAFGAYKEEIRQINPDVVVLFLHLKNLIIWPLLHWLKWKRIPVAFWTKGANLDEPDSTWRDLLFRYVHSRSDGIILYSGDEMSYIRERNRTKVWAANNTINFNDFPDVGESKEEIKKDVFRELDRSDVGCVIVGSGVSEELVSRMNKNNTLYLGEIHDPENRKIAKIFKMADVFCIPGHIGLGLNQAFYFGLPVVTEEGRQPPEIHYLVDGRNGFIVPENDIRELKNRLLFLLENDEARSEFSRNARNDILEQGSVENMFQGFLGCAEGISRGRHVHG
jgi:glycosyltransferase involved in cell wall biosynthesis